MILYFSFNLGDNDFSGLPTYSAMFLREFHEKEMVVINIIADPKDNVTNIVSKRVGRYIRIDCYLPNFLTSYKPELENLINEVLNRYKITNVVQPDYLVEEYLERVNLREKGVKKTLFVHLLYNGLMNKFVKEPYFEDHIMSSMVYLGKNSHTEWKAVATSDIIICNSEFSKREVLKYFDNLDLSKKEIYALPLGVEKDDIPYYPNLKSKKWAYFGRLDTMKGLWYLSKDWVLNPEEYKANPPIIMGDGMLEMLFMKAQFNDKLVDYRGPTYKPELYEVLKDVKYCVFPSIYEPYGLALNEALAMGKICIISNDDSGMHEQVTEKYKNGIVFDFKRDSVVNFINHNKLDLKDIPKRARETANDVEDHFKELEKILFGG